MLRKCSAIVGLIGITMILTLEAQAASLRVSPTQVELGTDGKAAAVKVTNLGDGPTTIQVVTMPWTSEEDPAGPAQEILAVPPVFDIPAGGEQTIRLAARGLDGELVEKAYVLHFKEVPDVTRVEGSGLAFVLNLELPLFVKPRSARPEVVWAIETSPDGMPSLSLANAGNAHLRVGSFSLSKLPGGESLVEVQESGYALAGEEKVWPLNMELEQLKGLLALKAETNIGPIEAVVSLPDN